MHLTRSRGFKASQWLLIAWFLVVGTAARGRLHAQTPAPESNSAASAIVSNDMDILRWEEVPIDQVVATLDMLAGQCRGNVQRLTTWEGTFLCELNQRIRKSSLPAEFARQVRPVELEYVRQETVFDVEFAADLSDGRLFNSKHTTRFRYLNDVSGEQLLKNLAPYDENSAYTADHFVRFAPKEIWGGFVPMGEGKPSRQLHLAFQEAPIRSRVENNLGIVSPIGLFGFSPEQRFGDELALFAECYTGKHGAEIRDFTQKYLKVAIGRGSAGPCFRIETAFKQSDENSTKLNHFHAFFDPAVEYQPVRLVFDTDKGDGTRQIRNKTDWTWRRTNDILLPARVVDTVYTPGTGELSYERTVTLNQSRVNPRLLASRFSYEALGMVDGDILDDAITKSRYKFQGGRLEKLAAEGIRTTPEAQTVDAADRYLRTRQMMAVSIVLTASLVFAMLRSRPKRLPQATEDQSD